VLHGVSKELCKKFSVEKLLGNPQRPKSRGILSCKNDGALKGGNFRLYI